MRASKITHGLRTKEMLELRRVVQWLSLVTEQG
jgi:hypothetical protein